MSKNPIRKLTCLAILLLIVGAKPPDANADQYGDYTYVSSGTNITIAGYTGTASMVSIPETIESLPVTTIGPYAFDSCTNVTDLVVPSSIRNIEYHAFWGCSGLTNLVLLEGMNGLGNPAFAGCDGLRTVALPASAVNASPIAFGCPNLTNYIINTNNPVHSSLDGVWFNKSHTVLVGFPRGVTGGYVVPDDVTTIGDSAFSRSSLETVTIPENVTDIGTGAFSYSGVLGLTIPQNVSSVDEYAFYGCTRLARISFLGNEPPEPYFPQWMFHDTQVQVIHYRAGTSWGYSWADIPAVRCTATTPELIPHNWLLSNFPGLGTDEEYELAAGADQDEDGMPSWEEYVADTSPTNGSDYFQISDITPTRVISWSSVSSRFYSVYVSTNLSRAWPEEPVCRIHGDGALKTYTNALFSSPEFNSIGVEFYR